MLELMNSNDKSVKNRWKNLYLYVCYTAPPGSFKAPCQPVRHGTGIRLRARMAPELGYELLYDLFNLLYDLFNFILCTYKYGLGQNIMNLI